MTREALLAFMRSDAVQASVSTGQSPQAAVVGIAVSDSSFNVQPPEIVEFTADALR
jgi:hypothetical protein